MSMFGSSWKDDQPSDDEVQRYERITGNVFPFGSKADLQKEIEKSKDSGHSSRTEQSDLSDLLSDINND